MSECTHPRCTKVIDKLGPMLDEPVITTKKGKTVITPGATAKILAWHWVCNDCGTTIEKESP